MPSLSDKLKSLGVKTPPGPAPPPPRATCPIEQVVPGRPCGTGGAYLVEARYSPGHRHGRARVDPASPPRVLAEWARDERLAGIAPGDLVFLDTETTGLSGGAGTYAFLIGVGRFEGGRFRLAQFFMRDPAEEPALLTALAEFLRPGDALVTFNGKSFDAPLLNARFVTNGLTSPLRSAAHIDLLPLARRLWRDRLPSRSLGYLETHVLEAARTDENVEGWMIPALYFDYLRTGDARPLKNVFYHNATDLLALTALFRHLAGLLDDPLNGAVEHGVDLVALGRLFEDTGRRDAAVQLYERGLERGLPEPARRDAVQRLSSAYRRRGDLSAAVAQWQEAARGRQVYAHVELAKFYEHRARDCREAERWTREAIALVDAPGFPPRERADWRAALEHRLKRLNRKNG